MASRLLAIAVALFLGAPASAHPGHGDPSLGGWLHALLEPGHAIPLMVGLAAGVALALLAARRTAAPPRDAFPLASPAWARSRSGARPRRRARDGPGARAALLLRALGCREERRSDALGLVQLRAGASLIDLVVVDSPSAAPAAGRPRRTARTSTTSASSSPPSTRPRCASHLTAHGVAPGDVGTRYGALGNGPSMYIRDPDANVVELKGPPSYEGSDPAFSAAAPSARGGGRVPSSPRTERRGVAHDADRRYEAHREARSLTMPAACARASAAPDRSRRRAPRGGRRRRAARRAAAAPRAARRSAGWRRRARAAETAVAVAGRRPRRSRRPAPRASRRAPPASAARARSSRRAREPREDRGLVARAGADLEHAVAGLEPQVLRHDSRRCRAARSSAPRRSGAGRRRRRGRAASGGTKRWRGTSRSAAEHARVADAARLDLRRAPSHRRGRASRLRPHAACDIAPPAARTRAASTPCGVKRRIRSGMAFPPPLHRRTPARGRQIGRPPPHPV